MSEATLTELAKNGILGILLAIALTVIWVLYKDNKMLSQKILDLYEKRVIEIRESRDVILEPLRSIKQTVELVLQSLNSKNKT